MYYLHGKSLLTAELRLAIFIEFQYHNEQKILSRTIMKLRKDR